MIEYIIKHSKVYYRKSNTEKFSYLRDLTIFEIDKNLIKKIK